MFKYIGFALAFFVISINVAMASTGKCSFKLSGDILLDNAPCAFSYDEDTKTVHIDINSKLGFKIQNEEILIVSTDTNGEWFTKSLGSIKLNPLNGDITCWLVEKATLCYRNEE